MTPRNANTSGFQPGGLLWRNALSSYALQAVTVLIGIFFTPIYLLKLGLEAFGLIGFFAVLQAWFTVFDLGLGAALTREYSAARQSAATADRLSATLRSAELLTAIAAVAACLTVVALSGWIAGSWLTLNSLSVTEVKNACSLMGLIVGLRLLENLYRAPLMGLQKQVVLNVMTGWMTLIRAAGALAVLTFVSNDVQTFFLWQAAVSLASVAVTRIICRSHIPNWGRDRAAWRHLRPILAFSGSSSAILALGLIISQIDKFVLSALLPLSEFSKYTLAAILAAYIRVPSSGVDQATYPRLVELCHDDAQPSLAAFYHLKTQISVVLVGPLAAVLIISSQDVLAVWTGQPELAKDSAALLTLLGLGMLGNTLVNGPYYLQLASGWTSLLLRMNAILALVFGPIIFLVASSKGAIGAAAAFLVVNIAYLVFLVRKMHSRILPTEIRAWYVSDIGIPLFAIFFTAITIRHFSPQAASRMEAGFMLALTALAAFSAGALAAPDVRSRLPLFLTWIRNRGP